MMLQYCYRKFLSCFPNNFLANKKRLSTSILNVFDRKTKIKHRDWSADLGNFSLYCYLREEVGDRVADRVYDIKRKFSVCIELGCGLGHVTKHLTDENVEVIYQCDMSQKLVEKSSVPENITCFKAVVDDENLPFQSNSVDIFLSSLNFHWINDLPGTFQQIHNCLRPDGVLIASMFGGDSLFELRSSLHLAEVERKGGVASHVSPFARIRDVGDLLSRAGFTMLTIDTDEIKICYPSMFELLEDLRGMAESNATWERTANLGLDVLTAAAAVYREMYGNEDKTIPATFEVIYLIGWKPHESQAQPAKRGSGQVSIKDLSTIMQKRK